jgi:hypothetical protein
VHSSLLRAESSELSKLMAAETTYIADYLEQHKDEILNRR